MESVLSFLNLVNGFILINSRRYMRILTHCLFNVNFCPMFLKTFTPLLMQFSFPIGFQSAFTCPHNSILRWCRLLYKLHCTCAMSQGTHFDRQILQCLISSSGIELTWGRPKNPEDKSIQFLAGSYLLFQNYSIAVIL